VTVAGFSGAEARQRILTTFGLVILVAFASYTNAHKVLWTDEAYSLHTTGTTLGYAVSQAINYELQPPVYYFLLHLWRRLDQSVEFARWLSTGSALATIVVLHALSRALGLSGQAVSLPLLAALCPFVLWAATEARPYALALLLTAAATWLHVRLLSAPAKQLRLLAPLYVGVWYLALLTFYYSGFLLLSQVVASIFIRRRTRLQLACAAVLGVLLLPWVPTILRQGAAHPSVDPPADISGATPWARAWNTLVWAYQYLLESVYFAPALRRPLVLAALALVAASLVVAYWRGRRLAHEPWMLLFGAATLIPATLLLGGKAAGVLGLQPRYLVVVVISLLTLMALAADRLPWRPGRTPTGVAMTLFGALSALSFQRISLGYEDWRAAADYVGDREKPGDVIFVFEPDGLLSFEYYYRGRLPVFGLPVDRPTDEYSVRRQAIRSAGALRARIVEKAGGTGSFWVVARHQHPAFGRYLLQGFLQRSAVELDQESVAGIEIGRYRLRASPEPHRSPVSSPADPAGVRR
jgi:mannosyltransferase